MYLFGFELITEIMMQKVAGGGIWIVSFKFSNKMKESREKEKRGV